jgi:hypothetical protein
VDLGFDELAQGQKKWAAILRQRLAYLTNKLLQYTTDLSFRPINSQQKFN